MSHGAHLLFTCVALVATTSHDDDDVTVRAAYRVSQKVAPTLSKNTLRTVTHILHFHSLIMHHHAYGVHLFMIYLIYRIYDIYF